MDPNFFRSTSHPVYHVETDSVGPRYVATDALTSLRYDDYPRESLPGTYFADSQRGQGYPSARRNTSQHSTRNVDNLVRTYDLVGRRDRGLELTSPEPITTWVSQTAPSIE